MANSRISVSVTLFAISAVSFVLIVLLTVSNGLSYYHDLLFQRLATTRTMTHQALDIANNYHTKQVSGALTEAEAKAQALADIKAIRYDGKEYIWVQDMRPFMLMHPVKPELDGKDISTMKDPKGVPLFANMVAVVRAAKSGYVDYEWPRVGSDKPVPKRSWVEGYAPRGWIVGSGVYVDDVTNLAWKFALQGLAAGALSCVLLVGVAMVVGRRLRARMQVVENALMAFAKGDLSQPVPPGGKDEIGRLLTAIGHAREGLDALVRKVYGTTNSIGHAALEMAQVNHDLRSRTEKTLLSLQDASAAIDLLSTSVQTSTDSAQQANHLAQAASQVAERGGAMVAQVVSTMDAISVSSNKINDIIGVIDGIAFQTNILALNAAVEAARAGEQGRGFAVVASEVRSLAGRSGEAAREIKQLISANVERVSMGSNLVGDAGKTMQEIVVSVQQVSAMIHSISATAAEQNKGISQVHGNVGELSGMARQNTDQVEKSSQAGQSLQEETHQLKEVVGMFRLQ